MASSLNLEDVVAVVYYATEVVWDSVDVDAEFDKGWGYQDAMVTEVAEIVYADDVVAVTIHVMNTIGSLIEVMVDEYDGY